MCLHSIGERLGCVYIVSIRERLGGVHVVGIRRRTYENVTKSFRIQSITKYIIQN
jgi:hypothetical protein